MIVHRMRGRTRHGTATLCAIILIGLIGATLAGIAASSAAEVRRTRGLAEEARLRQLLLAGAVETVTRSVDWKAMQSQTRWTLDLPEELKDDAEVKLQFDPASADTASVRVTARFRAHTAEQVLGLTHSYGKWEILSTQLEKR